MAGINPVYKVPSILREIWLADEVETLATKSTKYLPGAFPRVILKESCSWAKLSCSSLLTFFSQELTLSKGLVVLNSIWIWKGYPAIALMVLLGVITVF